MDNTLIKEIKTLDEYNKFLLKRKKMNSLTLENINNLISEYSNKSTERYEYEIHNFGEKRYDIFLSFGLVPKNPINNFYILTFNISEIDDDYYVVRCNSYELQLLKSYLIDSGDNLLELVSKMVDLFTNTVVEISILEESINFIKVNLNSKI